MATFENTFEGGTNTTIITPANSGGASGDAFPYVQGSPTFDSTRSAHGSLSAKLVLASGVAQYVQLGQNVSTWNSTDFAFRIYVYFTALPTAGFTLCRADTAAPVGAIRLNIGSDGKLSYAYHNNTAYVTHWTAVSAIPLNAWVRCEGRIKRHATAGEFEGAYYNFDSASALESFNNNTLNTGTTTIHALAVGKYGTDTTTNTIWADDLKVNTVATGLIGPWSNVPPVATIGAGTPATAVQNDVVPLRGTATDADGTATLAWTITSFPATMTGPPTITNPTSGTTASFTAVAPGTYNARLTATDNDGLTNVANKTITVSAITGGSGTDNVEYLLKVGGVWV